MGDVFHPEDDRPQGMVPTVAPTLLSSAWRAFWNWAPLGPWVDGVGLQLTVIIY